MKFKYLKCISIIVCISAAWIISGCTQGHNNVVMSTNPSITIPVEHSYPQMYTKEMLDMKDDVEQEYNVTFLGCYDDTQGAFLIWAWDNESGKCNASVVSSGRIYEIGCEEGWELYRQICLEVGNCV